MCRSLLNDRKDDFSFLLRLQVRPDQLTDPRSLVNSLLKRISCDVLQRLYNLPEFNSSTDFLALLAQQSGKLRKGGIPDITAAARRVLIDWCK